MKLFLFLFLLLLTGSFAQDDYSDDDYIGPAKTEKIIQKVNFVVSHRGFTRCG